MSWQFALGGSSVVLLIVAVAFLMWKYRRAMDDNAKLRETVATQAEYLKESIKYADYVQNESISQAQRISEIDQRPDTPVNVMDVLSRPVEAKDSGPKSSGS